MHREERLSIPETRAGEAWLDPPDCPGDYDEEAVLQLNLVILTFQEAEGIMQKERASIQFG